MVLGPCPACGRPLERAHASHGVFACSGCGGVWTDHAATQVLRSAHDDGIEMIARNAATTATTMAEADRPERVCPACRVPLQGTTIASVRLDYCPEHGTWYDRGEIAAVCNATKMAPGARRALDVVEICFGVLSLFG